MKMEYNALAEIRAKKGWDVLQALWAIQYQKIVEGMRKAGKQNKELNWRYFAGQLEGFEVAITQLDRAMKDMETKGEELEANVEAQEQVAELLRKVKGETQ